jgi:hypothetical protein
VTDTELETTVTQKIQRSVVLGDPEGVMKRQQNNGGDNAYGPRLLSDGGADQGGRGEYPAEGSKMMFGKPYRMESQFLPVLCLTDNRLKELCTLPRGIQ